LKASTYCPSPPFQPSFSSGQLSPHASVSSSFAAIGDSSHRPSSLPLSWSKSSSRVQHCSSDLHLCRRITGAPPRTFLLRGASVPSVSRPHSSVAAHSSSAAHCAGTISKSPRLPCHLPSTEHHRAPISLSPLHYHLILVCRRRSLLALRVRPTPRVVSVKTGLMSGPHRPTAGRTMPGVP
jgi:hypothetical protein